MNVLPLDAILAIVSALACFSLGLLVWVRRPKASGNILFGLISLCMGMWALTSWFSAETVGTPVWRSVWAIAFFLSLFLAPAIAAHAALYVSRKRPQRAVALIYAISLISCIAFIFPATAVIATGVTLLSYVGALLFMAIQLYPMTVGNVLVKALDRRNASYGIIILSIYLIAGGAQLGLGLVPSVLTLPILSALFLGISLLAFMRISFLDVDLEPIEAFFLPLFAFFFVGYLRASDTTEAVLAVISTASIGVFGIAAIRAVHGGHSDMGALMAENEQLRSAEGDRREFMDMVAHQLRTPLGGIRSAASMLIDGDYGTLTSEVKKPIIMIEDASTRLLTLTDTFLNASRVDCGSYRTHRDVTDVRTEVGSVVAELSVFAKGKGLTIEYDIDPSFEKLVKIDKEVLHNSLSNLLDNAVKYTKQGRIVVRCVALPGPRFSCSVTDTGQGMTEGDTSKLFKKFHRGKECEQDGLGLGLYVVKRLVDAAGGGISFSSEGPGKGSVFGFQLPYEQVDGEPADG